MSDTIASLVHERESWLDVGLAETRHGTYGIVLMIDGYYADEVIAKEMRDYWWDRLVEAGFPMPERVES